MKKVAILIAGILVTGNAWGDDRYSVSYSKEDLQTTHGVAALHARIKQIAQNHCPSYKEVRNLGDNRRCVEDVMTDLVSKVNNPRLTAYAQNPQPSDRGSVAALD
ncbi:MAG: UrcA family protein [Pseudomonadota bacterium]